MKYRWELLPTAGKSKIIDLATRLKVDPVIANLLIHRGIDSYQAAERFFNLKLANLFDPFLMKDMDKAVVRFSEAFRNGEKILIFGDYDVDGTTGTALLYNVLRSFYPNVLYYIPDRYSEGYGISEKGIDFASSQDISLIISVDCGIKANDKVDYAKQKNIDFIILDHHTPGETLPRAIAVLDPKRADDTYPFNELTGAGVAFKFLQALSQRGFFDIKELYQYLDLLVLSIAADIVPITGENRILAYYGLKVLNSHPSTGVKALKSVTGFSDKTLTIGHLAFSLGPRINAAGRIKHGSRAVELLIAKDYNYALQLAQEIDKLNRERQNIQQKIVKQILEQFEQSEYLRNKNSTVLYDPGWHKGVVGIVASKIIETHYKPTIILTSSEGKISGSARSVADFDLYAAIENCREYLLNFGGHKYAAGLTLKQENLERFIECFETTVSQNITPEQKTPVLTIAGQLTFDRINDRLVRTLKRLEPYGPGNPKPLFVTRQVRDTGYSRVVGKNSDHLILQLEDPSGNIITVKGFGMGQYFDKIKTRRPFDIAYTIEENEFNGKTSIELQLRDIKFDDEKDKEQT